MNKFDIIDQKKTVIQSNDTKLSKNILTKFEKTSIVGTRIEQLAYGSPSTLNDDDLKKCKNITQIAELELEKGVIPFMICRHLPNRTEEYWKIEDLIIPTRS